MHCLHTRYEPENSRSIEYSMQEEITNLPARLDAFNVMLHLETVYAELIKYNEYSRQEHVDVLGLSLSIGADDSLIRSRYRKIINLELPKETGHSVDELMSFPTYELEILFDEIIRKNKNRDRVKDKIKLDMEDESKK